jgi:hypothetical protein
MGAQVRFSVRGERGDLRAPPCPQLRGRHLRSLFVNQSTAQFVSLAQGLDVLGAIEALRALGLDDAAIALVHGDLDGARLQWLRFKE